MNAGRAVYSETQTTAIHGIHSNVIDQLNRVRGVNKQLEGIKARLVGPQPSPLPPGADAKDAHEPSTTSLHERLGSALSELEELTNQLCSIVG